MTTTSAKSKKLHIALFTAAAAVFAAVPAARASVVYQDLTSAPLRIPNTLDGIYLNLVTGVTGSSSTAVPGYDVDPYNNGDGLTFYGAASPSGILASGVPGILAQAVALSFGQLIGPSPVGQFYNQFQTVGDNFQKTGTEYLGLRFLNETTGVVDYGWLLLSTTARLGANAGFPASILGYAYENTGASINAGQTTSTVTAVPEPSTFALFGVALAAVAGTTARKRRRSA